GRRLFGIKGVGGWGRPIVDKAQRKHSGRNAPKINLFTVGVDEAKLIVMRRLAITHPRPGYSHFPTDRSPDWFAQLTAEK
ncbi:terminase gpA endonuclease subunit, partial [Xylella fastidiosa]|uniref:terminase gpA endonuclease subunit n=1 Tax=Xylella fastidiosa TaxID=2371 RepID=UPI001329DB47